MPGSQTPAKLDQWPLDEHGNMDLPGMVQYLSSRLVEYSTDAANWLRLVDQGPLDDILERVQVAGLAGLTEDDIPHLANAAALAVALDEIDAVKACSLKIAKHVEKARSELN